MLRLGMHETHTQRCNAHFWVWVRNPLSFLTPSYTRPLAIGCKLFYKSYRSLTLFSLKSCHEVSQY